MGGDYALFLFFSVSTCKKCYRKIPNAKTMKKMDFYLQYVHTHVKGEGGV